MVSVSTEIEIDCNLSDILCCTVIDRSIEGEEKWTILTEFCR